MTILFLQVRTLKEVKKLTQNIMLSEKSQTERQIVQSITSKWNLAGGRGVGGGGVGRRESNSKKQRIEEWLPGAGRMRQMGKVGKETKCQFKENGLRI